MMKKIKNTLLIGLILIAGGLLFHSEIVSALQIFTIPQGGTATSTIPSGDNILIGNGGNTYSVKKLTAGTNITIATTSSAVTISSSGTGSTINQLGQISDVSTTSPEVFGHILRYNDTTAKWESVATSTLGITASFSATYPMLYSGGVVSTTISTSTGEWGGTFDSREGSYYLDAANLTNFGTPFYTLFHATTTNALTEGSTNKYYADALARAALSSSATGLTYTSGTGAFSLTAGYAIPTTTRALNWDTAYGWGNHASGGYFPLTTWYATTTDGLAQGITNLYNQTHTGDVTGAVALTIGADKVLDTHINWGTGATQVSTDDITEGSTNKWWSNTLWDNRFAATSTTGLAEGTNLYYTDARARAAISETITGIDYSSGVFSLTSGYVIATTSRMLDLDNKVGYTDAAVNVYIHASTTIPKLYTGNTFTGLQVFSNTSTTTFAGGLQGTYLNLTGTSATSTVANGINLSAGCFAINGVCVGGSGTVTSVAMTVPTGLTIGGSPITGAGTLALGLDTGYVIATSTRLLTHDTAYSWGNHASAGYLTSAITSLGGLTGTTQTFATTSNNGGFGFSSVGTTHTFNIGNASANYGGLLTATDWNTFNNKQATISTTYPITLTGAAIGTAFGTTTANTFSALNIFGNASTTQLSVSGSLYIPNSTDPTILNSGQLGINTTAASSSLRFYNGTVERALYPIKDRSIILASSTLAYISSYGTTGSTTILIANPLRPTTITNIFCQTDTGTALVQFSDGTNLTDYLICSTAGTSDDGSIANNTFTMRENMKIIVGSQTGNPNIITTNVSLREDAD